MRYSGPQLLSSWLHVASAVSNQAAIPLAGLGSLGPLSYPLGAGSHAVLRTVGFGFEIEDRFALATTERDNARTDRAKLEASNRLETNEIGNRSYA
jgi:hypothetical protein